jgi:hypothetical protein
MNRKLCGPKSRSGRGGEGTRTPYHVARSPAPELYGAQSFLEKRQSLSWPASHYPGYKSSSMVRIMSHTNSTHPRNLPACHITKMAQIISTEFHDRDRHYFTNGRPPVPGVLPDILRSRCFRITKVKPYTKILLI